MLNVIVEGDGSINSPPPVFQSPSLSKFQFPTNAATITPIDHANLARFIYSILIYVQTRSASDQLIH